MQIMLPKSLTSAAAEVAEVVSDTELKIKKEFAVEGSKITDKIREATETEGLEFRKLPFIDQQDMYRNVYDCLNRGGSIGIFPEGSSFLTDYFGFLHVILGGSHDRTDLLPLKAGVSIMALGAMANDPNVRVKVVPVGLSYFHAHKFRSRAVVEFGRALDVPAELVEMFKLGGPQKREAVAKFLDLIFNALKTVTVRAPDYDTLMVSKYPSPSVRLVQYFIPAYSSCSAVVQDAWPASDAWASRRIEQAAVGRIRAFQRQAACPGATERSPQV
jgi:glycerol-3-phosphate O-acyltransferase/dihydroxyacetone phosphate acyltransferase